MKSTPLTHKSDNNVRSLDNIDKETRFTYIILTILHDCYYSYNDGEKMKTCLSSNLQTQYNKRRKSSYRRNERWIFAMHT